MPKLFIVLDGLDGSGKSEMVKRLHNFLFSKNKRYRILTTREPTNGRYGREVREILKTESDPMKNADHMLNLFTKDRKEHLKNIIIPFLESSNDTETNIVICDRYYYSTIAFQHTQGISLKKVIDKNKFFLKPDIALFFDLPADLALERISGRSKEKFEQYDFMVSLRKNFLNLQDILGDNIVIIDASKPKDDVFDQIKKQVEKLI